jgi:anti-sigma B factor antagonist
MLHVQVVGSDSVRVSVRGELVMEEAPGLRNTLTALLNRGDVTCIHIDLADVTTIDATGAGTLIVAHRIAANLRVNLRLIAVSRPAVRLLTLMAATDLVPVPRPA